jgi:hypothetical protein
LQTTGERAEVVVVDAPVGGEVSGDDVQEVVGVAEQPLCRDDRGEGCGGFFEVDDRFSLSPWRMVTNTIARNARFTIAGSMSAW